MPDVTTWFHHLYGEIKGVGGSAVKAELQNDTALRVGLANILRLSDQARRADPAHHLPPSPVMLRIYGLKTVGGDWKLRMMNAQRDSSYVGSRYKWLGVASSSLTGAHRRTSSTSGPAQWSTPSRTSSSSPWSATSKRKCPNASG